MTEALRLHRDEGNLPSALQSSGYLCPIKGIDSKQTDRGDRQTNTVTLSSEKVRASAFSSYGRGQRGPKEYRVAGTKCSLCNDWLSVSFVIGICVAFLRGLQTIVFPL